MGGARALIASLGASISLVAGAAVSLLFFSVVFALPGITGGDDAPAASAAVVVESQPLPARSEGGAPVRAASTAVVISAPKPAAVAVRPAARGASVARREAAADMPSFNPGVRDLGPPAPAPADASPVTSKPAIGDGVRDVGDAVTATVQGTGAAAGEATAPLLGPPVSQALQDVLDLLSSVVQGATGTLGGVLDRTVPR